MFVEGAITWSNAASYVFFSADLLCAVWGPAVLCRSGVPVVDQSVYSVTSQVKNTIVYLRAHALHISGGHKSEILRM